MNRDATKIDEHLRAASDAILLLLTEVGQLERCKRGIPHPSAAGGGGQLSARAIGGPHHASGMRAVKYSTRSEAAGGSRLLRLTTT